jgi:hypothetical protein
MSSVFTDPITGATSISGSLTVDNLNIRGMSLGSTTLSSNAIWLPSTSLQWTPVVAPNLPTFSIPNGGTMTYSRRNAVYRWIGNDVSYNINVAGLLNTQSTVTTGDYTLNVPYPINVAAYGANALIGELWLTTYYQTNSNSFKAYARTIASDANNVTIRVLTGTADVTLTTALGNTTMILQGTMTYNTSSFNQVGGVPAAYLPAAFYQNAAGQVLLNSNVIGGVVAPRGQLDIVYNSNLPAVVIDQLGTGDALQVKDGGVTQFVVSGTGNVGIGTANPTAKLYVSGDAQINGYLTGSISGMGAGLYASQLIYRLNSAYVGANVSTPQSTFGKGVTLLANTQYVFEAMYGWVKTVGATAHTFLHGFGGTVGINNISYSIFGARYDSADLSIMSDSSVNYAPKLIIVQSNTLINISGGSTMGFATLTMRAVVNGTISTSTGGTFIPQYQCSAAPGGAYSTAMGSYFKIWPVGTSGADINIGNWA